MKLEADGGFAWARSFPASGDPSSAVSERRWLVVDSSEAVYVTGSFRGGLQVEPGQPVIGTAEALSSFLIKLTKDGELAWAHAFGDCELDLGKPLIDTENTIWIGGGLKGPCRLDPADAGSELIPTTTTREAVLLRFDAATGAFVSGRTEPGLQYLSASVALDGRAGYFSAGTEELGLVLKTNGVGISDWLWSQADLSPSNIAQTPDGGVLAVGAADRGEGPLAQGPFVARIDPTGQSTWTLGFASPSGLINAIAANATHFVVVGMAHPTLDVDPGNATLQLPAGVFISHYAF